ncbi:MAG TPA: 4-hydroxybenzoate octaprenyltransferase [Thioalkalivibrio sp.]|nr:4-hydroxybenzoate octaprenyltransferase [Thioalkalivibrio sp.]
MTQPTSTFSPGQRLGAYARLVRIDRPIGIFLLLWPTLWSLWLAAEGLPDPWVLFVFVAGVVLMRSSGCAINDYADREIDPHVTRTRQRPLAAGQITAQEALAVFALLSLAAFLLVLTLNRLTILLSFAGVALAASYPFMKRFHHLPQVHLGVAFGWAIPMAWTAQTGELPPASIWLLFVANVLWTTAYDTMYAMSDREDDLKIGVKSAAILFGRHDRLATGLLQAGVLLLLVGVGLLSELGPAYYAGLVMAALLAAHEQWLIRDREAGACFHAFLHNNWFGLAVFIGLVIDLALR